MRPDTYDTIIDTSKELSKYGGWFCLSLIIYGVVTGIIYLIVVQGFDIPIPIMFFNIAPLILSFLTTMFIFMIKKTKERFGVTGWRNFWMAFGHPLCIDGGGTMKKKKIDGWLDENIPRLYRIVPKGDNITVVFRHKEDAMACKLRWS